MDTDNFSTKCADCFGTFTKKIGLADLNQLGDVSQIELIIFNFNLKISLALFVDTVQKCNILFVDTVSTCNILFVDTVSMSNIVFVDTECSTNLCNMGRTAHAQGKAHLHAAKIVSAFFLL